jgi:gas vesicle protein
MKAFLIGLGMGVGLGVLFAPMSGQKTRNTLQVRAQDLANSVASSARETYQQGRDRVQRTVSSIRREETRPTGTETGA